MFTNLELRRQIRADYRRRTRNNLTVAFLRYRGQLMEVDLNPKSERWQKCKRDHIENDASDEFHWEYKNLGDLIGRSHSPYFQCFLVGVAKT